MSTSSLMVFADILNTEKLSHINKECIPVQKRVQENRMKEQSCLPCNTVPLRLQPRSPPSSLPLFSLRFPTSVRFSCSSPEAALHVRVNCEGGFGGDGCGSGDWGVRRREKLKKWSGDRLAQK